MTAITAAPAPAEIGTAHDEVELGTSPRLAVDRIGQRDLGQHVQQAPSGTSDKAATRG